MMAAITAGDPPSSQVTPLGFRGGSPRPVARVSRGPRAVARAVARDPTLGPRGLGGSREGGRGREEGDALPPPGGLVAGASSRFWHARRQGGARAPWLGVAQFLVAPTVGVPPTHASCSVAPLRFTEPRATSETLGRRERPGSILLRTPSRDSERRSVSHPACGWETGDLQTAGWLAWAPRNHNIQGLGIGWFGNAVPLGQGHRLFFFFQSEFSSPVRVSRGGGGPAERRN